MKQKVLLPLISLIPLFFLDSVTASVPSDSEASQPSAQTGMVIPKKVCKIAQQAETENPTAAAEDKIVGTVYSVVGDVVMVELDGGGTRAVNLDRRREGGHIGHLTGRRVVITPYVCSRINLSPSPVVIPAATEVPKIDTTPSAPAPTIPPAPTPTEQPAPVPNPTEQPAPQPSPTIIPQTW
jgi:hypothetical protein